MSAISTSFKRTANNPRKSGMPWQLHDKMWKHCKHQERRLARKICVNLVWRPKNMVNQAVLSLYSDLSRFTEQIPKILEDNSKHFWAFWETLFVRERVKKKASKYIWDRKVSRLFLRNEHQLIAWELRFQPWLNLYITLFSCVRVAILPFLLIFYFFFFFFLLTFLYNFL